MDNLIFTISDTVLGYGSPQIFQFTRDLACSLNSRALICQPFLSSRPPINIQDSVVELEILFTSLHPASTAGRREYVESCARLVNKYKPKVLIFSHYTLFDIVDLIDYKPQIIHLALEDLELKTHSLLDSAKLSKLHKQSEKVDLWIFPEINRARSDSNLLRIPFSKIYIFLNAFPKQSPPLAKKNGRFIHAGTLDYDNSIGQIIFDQDVAKFPIDVFGDLQGTTESKNSMKTKIKDLETQNQVDLKWFGQIPGAELNKRLPSYNFSIVYWLPTRPALLNAAPNKFFQAIELGVPVLSAPHPQCKQLIDRYGCGILLESWSKSDFIKGLKLAFEFSKTKGYENLIENCKFASEKELSWLHQFGRFLKFYRSQICGVLELESKVYFSIPHFMTEKPLQ